MILAIAMCNVSLVRRVGLIITAQIPYNEVAINIADNDQIRSILIIAAFIWYFFAIFFFSIRHPTCMWLWILCLLTCRCAHEVSSAFAYFRPV